MILPSTVDRGLGKQIIGIDKSILSCMKDICICSVDMIGLVYSKFDCDLVLAFQILQITISLAVYITHYKSFTRKNFALFIKCFYLCNLDLFGNNLECLSKCIVILKKM